jgi:hypothetical protein
MRDRIFIRWRLPGNDWPMHGWIGLALVLLFWILNWSLSGPRTHWGFFPLWLGYCLTVDALVFVRKGHSLCGLYFIDTQDHPSYTCTVKKEVLININRY